MSTDTAINASNSGGISATTSHPSMNILSDKVQRALQVRTDTPAMKAALEALGQLDDSNSTNNVKNASSSGANNLLDARSVRHAIELDALQQALLLQQDLSGLVSTIQELRQGISETAAIAHRVKEAIHGQVLTEETPTSMISTSSSSSGTGGTADDVAATKSSSNTAVDPHQQQLDQQHAEEKLAAGIAEAFQRRNVARHRLEAVTQFLETFDLSEQDSRLLDHYNFEDMAMDVNHTDPSTASSAAPNGMAFLRALERVRQIRRALVKTFGSAGGMGGSSGSSSDMMMMMMGSSAFGSSSDSSDKSSGGLGASSALRMMESLAQKQEHAYERLYHWLQSYLHLLGKTTPSNDQQQQNFDVGLMQLDQSLQHPFVQDALYTLRHVHAFYHHTVELLAGRRRQEETRLFLLALTTGIPQEQQTPLERLAHDPTMYVGEMLAHAFRALTGEADVALAVIHYKPSNKKSKKSGGGEEGMENEGEEEDKDDDDDDDEQEEDDLDGSAHDSDNMDYNNMMSSSSMSGTDKAMTATQMLSVTMSGMSRPLRARVQQVISTLARQPKGGRNRNASGDLDGTDLEEVDSDDNMMMLGGDDDDDDDIMFEEEGAIVRNKLTHLYEICGLVLFYISAMNKTVAKVQEADLKKLKRKLLKRKSKTSAAARDDGLSGTPDEAAKAEDDDVLENAAAMMEQEEANALVTCLMECLEEAANAYEATIRVYCAMLHQLSLTTGESQPSLALAMMVRIAEVRMSSPGFAQDVIGTYSNQACRAILSIEWVTETLVQAALPNCTILDDAVALKQAVATAKKADLDVIVGEKLDEQIEDMEVTLIDNLVELESAKVLDLCGLGPVVAAWQRWKQRSASASVLVGATEGEDDDDSSTSLMVSYPGLSGDEVEASMKDFHASLYSPPLPSLESAIKDPLFRKRARIKIAENICQIYAEVYADITSVSKGGYNDVSFLGHTPEQVKTLFSA